MNNDITDRNFLELPTKKQIEYNRQINIRQDEQIVDIYGQIDMLKMGRILGFLPLVWNRSAGQMSWRTTTVSGSLSAGQIYQLIPTGANAADYISTVIEMTPTGSVILLPGDYSTQMTTLTALNVVTGLPEGSVTVVQTYQAASNLAQYDATINEGVRTTVLHDADGTRRDYVSIKLTNSASSTWVRYGVITDGRDGRSIYEITATSLAGVLAIARQWDIFVATQDFTDVATGLTFNNGDVGLYNPYASPIWAASGNIAVKGDTGATPNITAAAQALAPGSQPTVDVTGTPENPTMTFGLVTGDTGVGIQSITTSRIGSQTTVLITMTDNTPYTFVVNDGDAAMPFNIAQGIFTQATLPAFSSAPANTAFVVLNTSPPVNTYDLYIKSGTNTAWTIVPNWGGTPGDTGLPALTYNTVLNVNVASLVMPNTVTGVLANFNRTPSSGENIALVVTLTTNTGAVATSFVAGSIAGISGNNVTIVVAGSNLIQSGMNAYQVNLGTTTTPPSNLAAVPYTLAQLSWGGGAYVAPAIGTQVLVALNVSGGTQQVIYLGFATIVTVSTASTAGTLNMTNTPVTQGFNPKTASARNTTTLNLWQMFASGTVPNNQNVAITFNAIRDRMATGAERTQGILHFRVRNNTNAINNPKFIWSATTEAINIRPEQFAAVLYMANGVLNYELYAQIIDTNGYRFFTVMDESGGNPSVPGGNNTVYYNATNGVGLTDLPENAGQQTIYSSIGVDVNSLSRLLNTQTRTSSANTASQIAMTGYTNTPGRILLREGIIRIRPTITGSNLIPMPMSGITVTMNMFDVNDNLTASINMTRDNIEFYIGTSNCSVVYTDADTDERYKMSFARSTVSYITMSQASFWLMTTNQML